MILAQKLMGKKIGPIAVTGAGFSRAENPLSMPVGSSIGELLIIVASMPDGATNISIPTGCTLIASGFGGSERVDIAVLTKVITDLADTLTFTISGGANSTLGCISVANCSGVDVVGAIGASTSLTMSAPSITPTKKGLLIFAGAAQNGALVTPPSGFTEQVEKDYTAGNSTPLVYIASKSNISISATGAIAATKDTAKDSNSLLIQLKQR